MSLFTVNLIRYFTALQCLALVGLSLYILVSYMDLRKMRARPRDGALPWHILLMSTSYIWFAVEIGIIMVTRALTEFPATWTALRLMVASIIGLAALIFMLVHLRIQRKYFSVIRDRVIKESYPHSSEP